ncbi:MAG: hypothetical protein CME61_05835, partial [Halobacteriovoraceae bacterium]|nr:hypothetical protein [Halobacteriovoraceae bacterium]
MFKNILLTILILALGFVGFYFNKKEIHLTSFTSEFVKENTYVSYDERGVARIKASTWSDAQFALGYVMARDRLWQMEVLRRASGGMLSEIFGEKTLKVDKLMRTLRLRSVVEKQLSKNKIKPEVLLLINPFLKGMNKFISEGNYPLEFDLLGLRPNKWTVLDMISISGIVSFSFAEGMILDSLIASLLNDFTKDEIGDLLIKVKNDFRFKEFKKNKTVIVENEIFKELSDIIDAFSHPIGFFKGSNSWVVAGSKTKSKKTMLANDPHIAFSNPSFWYEASIDTPEHSLYGFYLPGVPFAGLGHNKFKAWAITMSQVDDVDVYIEKFNPKNNEEVMVNGVYKPLKKNIETIKVKGKEDYKHIFYETIHGPLLKNTAYDRDVGLSLKWAYHHPDNNIIQTFYELNTFKTLDELPRVLSHATAPGFNVSAIDSKGNIGWHVMGKIAVRPDGQSGAFPLEGWSGKHDNFDYLDIDQNPHLYNPESGYIASANYYPEVDFGRMLNGQWQPQERINRLHDILPKKD